MAGIFDYLTNGWGGTPGLFNRPPDRPYDYDQPYQQPEQLLPKQDQPHTWDEAVNAWYGLTGIPDIQKGWETYQQGGGILPAIGQAGMGAANLAGLAIPAAKMLPGAIRTIGPMLGDEIGAVGSRIPRRGARGFIDQVSGTAPEPEGPYTPPPAMGGNQPPPEARFPQYAEEYPPLGPPEWATDKTTQKPYLTKGWSPEMVAFDKERARVAKDMTKNGFEPYFDPAQRSNVDPSYYPPNLDTATVVPAKQTTIDTHMASVGSEDARARLQAAYQRGSQMPDTSQWYAMKQLEDAFIRELGPDAGRKAFQDKFATSMAATTGGANPESNFLMAMYGNYLRTKGLPYPRAAYEMPYPIGGRYATGNMEQHQKIMDAGGFSALGAANPKRHDFSQAFTGNPEAATMDEQMTSGMTPGQTIPKYYGLNTQVAREEAAKVVNPDGTVGIAPRDFQDVAWAGFKNLKDPKYQSGVPFIQTVNESVERTHRLTGMPREEIVRRGIIHGDIPMYMLLGGVGLGGLGGLGGSSFD